LFWKHVLFDLHQMYLYTDCVISFMMFHFQHRAVFLYYIWQKLFSRSYYRLTTTTTTRTKKTSSNNTTYEERRGTYPTHMLPALKCRHRHLGGFKQNIWLKWNSWLEMTLFFEILTVILDCNCSERNVN
jgi:hypothetical protein